MIQLVVESVTFEALWMRPPRGCFLFCSRDWLYEEEIGREKGSEGDDEDVVHSSRSARLTHA